MTSQLRTQTYRSFDLADNSPSEHDAEEEAYVRIRRFGKTLAAALLKRCARMLPADWRILLWSKETDEAIIASHGSVQIRHVPGGCVVQTCVKGDMNLARGTALLRLVKYVSGDNQRAARLDAERPLLQQRKAPGLWQIAVRLIRSGRCAGGAGAPREKATDRRPRADHMGRRHASQAGRQSRRSNAPKRRSWTHSRAANGLRRARRRYAFMLPLQCCRSQAVSKSRCLSSPTLRTNRPGTAAYPLVQGMPPPTVRPTRQAYRFTDRSWSGHQRWVQGSRAGLRSAMVEQVSPPAVAQ